MNTELKTQLKQSAKAIAEAVEKWQRVKEIAEDIAAWCNHDIRRFRIEINNAVGTKIINFFVTGADRYLIFGESAGNMPLKEVFNQFLESDEALVNMIRKLAEAVTELAKEQIEQLEDQL
jgi:hypothetical protein